MKLFAPLLCLSLSLPLGASILNEAKCKNLMKQAGEPNLVPAYNKECFIHYGVSDLLSKLPIKIDAFTEITSAIAAKESLTYIYTISAAAPLDNVKVIKKSIRAQVIKGNCAHPMTRKYFLNNDITLKHHYFVKGGSALLKFDVTKSSCEN